MKTSYEKLMYQYHEWQKRILLVTLLVFIAWYFFRFEFGWFFGPLLIIAILTLVYLGIARFYFVMKEEDRRNQLIIENQVTRFQKLDYGRHINVELDPLLLDDLCQLLRNRGFAFDKKILPHSQRGLIRAEITRL